MNLPEENKSTCQSMTVQDIHKERGVPESTTRYLVQKRKFPQPFKVMLPAYHSQAAADITAALQVQNLSILAAGD